MIEKVIYGLLILFTLFTLSSDLTTKPVELWDEATNIAVVNDTLAGNSLLLTKNGANFFEKPPLWYYLTLPVTALLGSNLLSFRLVSVLSAVGLIVFALLIAKELKNKWYGISVWLLLLVSPMLWITNYTGYFSSHTFKSADLDALQLFMIVGAAYFFLLLKQRKQYKFFHISNILLGLGFLAKGPLVVYFLALHWLLAIKGGLKLKQLLFSAGLFLLIAGSWYLFNLALFGYSFWSESVNYHILSRFLAPLEGHSEHPFFYLQIFLDFRINPFWPLLPISLYLAFKRRSFWGLYTGLITLSLLVILSLAQTKLAWYILPVFVFNALALASLIVKKSATMQR